MGALSIIVVVVFANMSLQWYFEKEHTSLYKDDDLIVRYRWHLESERTYINKNSWYRENVMCPRIVDNGGHETNTRCYYPDDTYEILSRSLVNTDILKKNNSIIRETPFYAYGTRGSYAGILNERTLFEDTENPEEFPKDYSVNWTPRDTRNYKLVWRIWELDDLNLDKGNYTDCEYRFGDIKIDLKDSCSDFERAEVKDDETIWFYFNNKRGIQKLNVSLVDPPSITLNSPGDGEEEVELPPLLNVTVFNPEGDNMDVGFYGNDFWNLLTTSYDDISLDTYGDDPQGMSFSSDGTKLYEVDYWDRKFYQHTCSDAWNISSCSYSGVSKDVGQNDAPLGMFFKPDGTKLYDIGYEDKMYQHTCSEAWDLSSCSLDSGSIDTQTGVSHGMFFKPDGTKLYEISAYEEKIYQYTCSNAWELTSCSYSGVSIDTQDSQAGDLFFKPDGTKLYEVGNGNKFYQYTCSDAWDLSSCSYSDVSIDTQGSHPKGMFFKPDGTKLYEVTDSSDKFYQYSLSELILLNTSNNIANNSEATYEWDGLNTGTTYEWYANATDGTDTTISDTWNFTTASGPQIEFIPPTPENNSLMNFEETTINTSIEAQDTLDTAILYWNEPNYRDYFNDTTTKGNLSYFGEDIKTKYIEIPLEAEMEYAYFNFTGFPLGNFSETSIYQQHLDGSSTIDIRGDDWIAQTFNTSENGTHFPSKISLFGYRIGDPENITVSLRENLTGEDIINKSYSLDGLTTSSSGEWFDIQFDFHDELFYNDTEYSIVIRVPEGDFSNRLNLYYASEGTYDNGNIYESTDGGSSWNEGVDSDLIFKYHASELQYPSNIWLQVGDIDGFYDWQHNGELQETQRTDDLKQPFDDALNDGNCDCANCSIEGDLCTIPVNIRSESIGRIQYSDINNLYTWGTGYTTYKMNCTGDGIDNICQKTIYNSTRGVDYSFYVWANDSLGENKTTEERFTIQDEIPPKFFDESVSPPNNSVYDSNINDYYFNISVEEHNLKYCNYTWDGVEYSPTELDSWNVINYTFGFNKTDLVPGEYTYGWYCEDLDGNHDETSDVYYLLKEESNVTLKLDGSEANTSINESQIVNITGILNEGDGEIDLLIDGEIISSGTSPQTNLYNFTYPGIYNVSVIHNETTYYNKDIDTYWVEVNDTTNPKIEPIFPENGTMSNVIDVNFTANITDNYGIKNATFYLYDNESLLYNITESYYGIGNKSIIEEFEYSLPDEEVYKWYVETYDTFSFYNRTENQTYDLRFYPDISLNYPSSGLVVPRPTTEDFYVMLNITMEDLTPDLMNVSFYNNETNEIISNMSGGDCDFTDVSNGTQLNCYWDENFIENETYEWYVQATDGETTVNSSVWNFSVVDTQLKNLHVSDMGNDYVTFTWENIDGIDKTEISFYEGFECPGTLKVYTTTVNGSGVQSHNFTDLIEGDPYSFEWSIGNKYIMGEKYNTSFKSAGWPLEYTLMPHRNEIHSLIDEDKDNYVSNITLTEENFVYNDSVTNLDLPAFTLLNWTNLNDIRFLDSRNVEKLNYNVTDIDIIGEGGITSQTPPNESKIEGYISNEEHLDDSNWNTLSRCEDSSCKYYFNYSRPNTSKREGYLTLKIQETVTEYFDIPSDCFGNDTLQFLINFDGDLGNSNVTCKNVESNDWDYYENISTSILYESEMSFIHPSSANILVESLYFNESQQNYVKGLGGGYNNTFTMYYGDTLEENNETSFDYEGTSTNFLIDDHQLYKSYPPEIIDFSLEGMTESSVNFTWKTERPSNNIVKYADNKWLRDAKYSDWENESTSINIMIDELLENQTYYYEVSSYSPINNSLVTNIYDSFILGTPAQTPSVEFLNYTEYRKNSSVEVCGNLTDMDIFDEVNLSIVYFSSDDVNFSETDITEATETGSFCEVIDVDYGKNYNYSIKGVGDNGYPTYSDAFENEFMKVQELFIGDWMYDDENNRMRREVNPVGPQIDTWRGYREGSYQKQDFVYIETNLSTENTFVRMWTGDEKGGPDNDNNVHETGWSNHTMNTNGNFSYVTIEDLNNSWHSFEIWNESGPILNHTKPSLHHTLGQNRTDQRVYLRFNGTVDNVEYKTLYMGENLYEVAPATHCSYYGDGTRKPLMEFLDCRGVVYWEHYTRDFSGEGNEPYGTAYDRGMMQQGQVVDGSNSDTGVMYAEPFEPENESSPQFVLKNCHTFWVWFWGEETTTEEVTIENYYFRGWEPDLYASSEAEEDTFITTTEYLHLFEYSEEYAKDTLDVHDANQRPWLEINGTGVNYPTGTIPGHEDDCDADFCFSLNDLDNYTGKTEKYTFPESYIRYENQSSIEPNLSLWGVQKELDEPITLSKDEIYDFGIRGFSTTDWPTMITSKNHQSFIIYNLPDNETLKTMDTDGDGLSDYDELYVHYTNPKENDTDGGGIDDYTEVMISDTNPNLWHDEETDPPQFSDINWSPENSSYHLEDTEYAFSVNVTDENLNESSIIIEFDGVNHSVSKNIDDLFVYEVEGLDEGWHNFTWYAKDNFLNKNKTKEFNYYVAPSISASPNTSINPNVTFSFYPDNSTHKRVEPLHQSEGNWTMKTINNQSETGRIVLKVQEEYNTSWGGDLVVKMNDVYNYSSAKEIKDYYRDVSHNSTRLDTNDSLNIWFWADYYHPTRQWEPDVNVMIQEV
ncbi:MAG: hypothetical protein ACOCZ5_00690 [bacterium]